MKQAPIFLLILAFLLLFCLIPVQAENPLTVSVTITDGTGTLPLAQASVSVSDKDGDGVLTANDALLCAHETYYIGGAEAGYLSEETQYGISLVRLWGVENGGSYGCFINNQPIVSLADSIKNGDSVTAYAYSDLTTWSDIYSYFDVTTRNTEKNEEFTVTLSAYTYDEAWNPVVVPVADAVLLVNGTETEYRTDKTGTVALSLPKDGSYVISATHDSMTLVPPCVIVHVVSSPLFSTSTLSCLIAIALILVIGIPVFLRRYLRQKKATQTK